MTQTGKMLDAGRWLEDPGQALTRVMRASSIARLAGRAGEETLPQALAVLGPLMAGALRREGDAPILDLTLDALAPGVREQTLTTLLHLHGPVTGPALSEALSWGTADLYGWPMGPGLLTDLARAKRSRDIWGFWPLVRELDTPGEVERAVDAWAGDRPVYHGHERGPLHPSTPRWWLSAENLVSCGPSLAAAALVVHTVSGTLPGVSASGEAGLDGLAARVGWLTPSGQLTPDAAALLLGAKKSLPSLDSAALGQIAMLTPQDWLVAHWETVYRWVIAHGASLLMTRSGRPRRGGQTIPARIMLTAPLWRRDLTPMLAERLAWYGTRPTRDGGVGETEEGWLSAVSAWGDDPELTLALLPPTWRAAARTGGVPADAARILMRWNTPRDFRTWGAGVLASLRASAAGVPDVIVVGPGGPQLMVQVKNS